MAVIFEYDCYKPFIKETVSQMPKKGRGVYKLLGEHLNVGSVVISQIFNGHKDLTVDQGLMITEYFALGKLETDYFLLLVGLNRASNYKLKEYYTQELKALKTRALDLREYLKKNTELDDKAKQKFYSDWSYSAIRLTCCIESINTPDEISKHLNLDPVTVREKLQFLLNNGLVTEIDGKLDLGTSTTFLDKKDPLINTHRKNWRLKAMDKFSQENDLFLVAPMCLSIDLKKKLHTKLLKAFNEILEEVPHAEAEELICVNIDLFSVK